jgi:hypothetical protein
VSVRPETASPPSAIHDHGGDLSPQEFAAQLLRGDRQQEPEAQAETTDVEREPQPEPEAAESPNPGEVAALSADARKAKWARALVEALHPPTQSKDE